MLASGAEDKHQDDPEQQASDADGGRLTHRLVDSYRPSYDRADKARPHVDSYRPPRVNDHRPSPLHHPYARPRHGHHADQHHDHHGNHVDQHPIHHDDRHRYHDPLPATYDRRPRFDAQPRRPYYDERSHDQHRDYAYDTRDPYKYDGHDYYSASQYGRDDRSAPHPPSGRVYSYPTQKSYAPSSAPRFIDHRRRGVDRSLGYRSPPPPYYHKDY